MGLGEGDVREGVPGAGEVGLGGVGEEAFCSRVGECGWGGYLSGGLFLFFLGDGEGGLG